MQNRKDAVMEAVNAFDYSGRYERHEPLGNGHINETFLVTCREGEKRYRYTLQRINNSIFKDPKALVQNLVGVTAWLRDKVLAEGGDPERETTRMVPTRGGEYCFTDSKGGFWKSYVFIDGVTCYDLVEKPEHFYQCGRAFGRFQGQLADYPAHTLSETIPDFHNTPKRYEAFEAAVAADVCGRAADVAEEIAFVRARASFMHTLTDLQAAGELPLKVTHNDTKLNNAMIDDATGQAICIIDLDTVMPGLSVNDFGDSIRFGATTGAEDEPDLRKVNFDLALYEAYTRGFLEGCAGRLTEKELWALPVGAKMMTLECGMRFLTDHLQGDTYFRIHREGHNLDRCRTQFKLVADMENCWEQMYAIVEKYR